LERNSQSNRQKISLTPELRKAKEELFKKAFSRIEKSISQGFHLEAIAIIESLICDRLETSVTVITGEPTGVKNLGPLLKKLEEYPEFPKLLVEEIDLWRSDRNLVMHRMVKITSEEVFNWQSRMKFARATAIEGFRLVKRAHAATNRLKRENLRGQNE
jgi:hypothetical protein